MKIRYIELLSMFLVLVLFSCKNETKPKDVKETPPKAVSEFIVIDKEQYLSEAMEMGSLTERHFSKSYQTTGKIITNYLSSAKVNSYIPGRIHDIKVELNQIVKKGDVLIRVESNEFIELQKNYLVAKAQLKPITANYKRQQELYNENFASEKSYLEAEAEYKILLAEMEATLAKLKNLRSPIESILEGKVLNCFNVIAPIDGQVQQLDIQIGQFVEPQEVLMDIVNDKNALLEFVIYADFASSIKVGQHVHFNTSVDKDKEIAAEVISVGQSMNSDLQGVVCQAKVLDDEVLLPGSKVMLELFYNNQTGWAIERNALIELDGKPYILLLEKEDEDHYYFSKMEIETGLNTEKYIEVKSPQIQKPALVKGVYYVNLEN